MTARPGGSTSTACWRRSSSWGRSRRGSTASSTRRWARALNSTGGVAGRRRLLRRHARRGAHLERRAVGGADPGRQRPGNPDARRASSDAGASTTRAAACSTRPATTRTARCPARTARSSPGRRSPSTPNTAPVVNAGPDQPVTLPATGVAQRHGHRRRPARRRADDDVEQGERTRNGDVRQRLGAWPRRPPSRRRARMSSG